MTRDSAGAATGSMDTSISNRSFAPDPSLRHRIADSVVTVLGTDGQPMTNVDVRVAQRRHAFLFGCIGFDLIAYANGEAEAEEGNAYPFGGDPARQPAELARLWLELFNFATLPFYWGNFEPERGRPDTRRLLTAAHWFTDHGCVVKGHPLAWHTVTAPWLLDLSNEEILAAQLARIRREVSDFAGAIDMWDVINEVVIMPVFDKYDNAVTRVCREFGRIATVRAAFDQARAANPRATLLLNDFDTSTAYECLIEGCLEAGVRIDALGLQSHMHQGYWGEEKTLAIVDRFARYGLPIHFTESTLVSGHLMPPDIEDLNDYQVAQWPSTPDGEARQADEVVRHYRTLLSHPAVEAITYWGLSDAGAWLGAPVGLVRADGTPKPSHEALRGLIKGEWWLKDTTVRSDDVGRIPVRGFLGEYDVAVGSACGTLLLDAAGSGASDVTLQPAG
jgi:endo-1,4-beta-xylanase